MRYTVYANYGAGDETGWVIARRAIFNRLLAGAPVSDDYDARSHHYWVINDDGRPLSCARVVAGHIGGLPSARYFTEKQIDLPDCPIEEPSRFGSVDRRAFLALIGRAVAAAAERRAYWILTARAVLLQALVIHPFELHGPPLNSADMADGPHTNEPIWIASIDPRAAIGAVAVLDPGNFRLMFPEYNRERVLDDLGLPDANWYRERSANNARQRVRDLLAWRAAHPRAPVTATT